MAIIVESTGLVYRNPHPNLRAVHAWHPTVTKLENGELLCAFDLGQGCESMDYCTHLSRSRDQGRTWEAPYSFLPECSTRYANTLARISTVADGTVVAFGGYLYRDDPQKGFVNPENMGYTAMDLFLSRSTDGGQTWESPHIINTPLVGPSWEICHAIVELTDGRWLAPVSTWKGWNGEAPNGMKAVALVSYNRGQTWPDFLDVMDNYANGIVHFEQSLVQLPDGRLLAVAWALEEYTGKTLPTPYAISADGHTFGTAQWTGILAQTAKLVVLNDGRLLCLYRRHDRPGLWSNLVRLEGEKWINLEETLLWCGAESGMQGMRKPGVEMKELRFGFPQMMIMPDGSVFAVFWCQEECVNNIRWIRLFVT